MNHLSDSTILEKAHGIMLDKFPQSIRDVLQHWLKIRFTGKIGIIRYILTSQDSARLE